jgi:hypothetical protein
MVARGCNYFIIFLGLLTGAPVALAAHTYTYTGQPFTASGGSSPSSATNFRFEFTTNAPLVANGTYDLHHIVSWTATDGVVTYASSGPYGLSACWQRF